MGFFDRLFGRSKEMKIPSASGVSTGEKSQAAPKSLTREQMDLLWMDRTGLAVLKASLGNPSVAVIGLNHLRGIQDQKKVTTQDIEWAEHVMGIAESATAASQRGDFARAIQIYKEALERAPECDLYLMSIGCCYGNLQKPGEGLPYLERAAAISPNNARIRNNLAGLRRMLG